MSNPIVIPDLEEYPEKYDDVVITEDLQEDWQKDPEIKAAFDRMKLKIAEIEDDWDAQMRIKLDTFGELLTKSLNKNRII